MSILSVCTGSAYFVYLSYILKRSQKNIKIRPDIALIASHLSSAIFISPFLEIEKLSNTDYSLLILTTLFLVISRQLYYYAYAHAEVSDVTVFSALTPVYTLFSAFFITNEWPPNHKLIGMLLITTSIYFLFLQNFKANSFKNFIISFTSPFTKILNNRALLAAFLSTIPTAFAAVWQKLLIEKIGTANTAMLLLYLIGFLSLFITISKLGYHKLLLEFKKLPMHFWPVSALLFGSNHIIFCIIMKNESAAISLVIQRSSIMLQIVLAYFFLNEKNLINKKLILAGVILLGFVSLFYPL